MGWLDSFKAKLADIPAGKLACPPDPKALPGQKVYHEYFIGENAISGRATWHVRVYAGGVSHEMTGSAETDRQARIDAMTWATEKKTQLRGDV